MAGWKNNRIEDSFWSSSEKKKKKTRDDILSRDIALDRARSLRGLFFANWTEPSLKLIFRASLDLFTNEGWN